MDLGTERVARAKLSEDYSTLDDVDVLAEGVERNIVLAPDGTMFVLGADRFRFYDSDLDGVSHDFTDNPGHPPQLHGPRHSHQPRRLDPERQPVAQPRDGAARDLRARVQGSRRRRDQSADARAVGRRSRPSGRRRDQHRPGRDATTGGPTSPTARSTTRGSRTAGRTCPSAAARTGRKASRSRSTSGCRRSRRRE